MWQVTFVYTEPISSNDVQITCYGENYDDAVNKAVSFDAPALYKKSLRLVEAIEMDDEIIFESEEDSQNG